MQGGLVAKCNGAPPMAKSLRLPLGAPISALAVDGTTLYFTAAHDWQDGGTLVTPRDIARLKADGRISVARRSADAGLSGTTRIHALSVRDGETLVSLATAATLPAGTVSRRGMLQWGTTLSVLDVGAGEIPTAMNLVALDRTAASSLLMARQ